MIKPEIIIRWSDSLTDACGWLVIDRLINGVCGGGTFMHASATEKEVTDLSQTMSYKNALQRIPLGGAKAGIRYDHTRPDAADVLERFLRHVKPWLETVWCTGADLNTSNLTMQRIIRSLELHSLFSALGKMVAHRLHIKDQSAEIFSRMTRKMTPFFSLAEGATGYSVALVIGLICRKKNPRVFIQGFGSVGRSLCYFIQEMNLGKVVGISDAEGVLYHEEGIDSHELLNAFYSSASQNQSMNQWLDDPLKRKYHYQKRNAGDGEEAYIIESLRGKNIDVFSPCATRYALTAKVVDSIAMQYNNLFIIAGANNVFDSSVAYPASAAKNIHCFPEWISNSGNALLYEELLCLPELPADYVPYLKDLIRKRIHSFIDDSLPDAYRPELWHKTFIRTAENRIAQTKTREAYESAVVLSENFNAENITLSV